MPRPPAILWFEDITDADAGQVGGKGFELARLLRAGLPVPRGFVVTADAYRLMNGVSLTSPLQSQIEAANSKLGNGTIAVRSSALGEDGAETSFAGQMTTILGVRGMPSLVEAIRTCWASLRTERAVAYRKQHGLNDNPAMAVVVQQLVPADVAGVAFTYDPNDADGECMAIEASWGLGEAVVSGRVTPDRYSVRFADGAVLERHPGNKDVRIDASGESPVPAEQQSQLCLSDSQLAELAKLCRKVEAFYDSPRDIEWAITEGKLFLLQARPITTSTAAEREGVRAQVILGLRGQGDCWVKDNLSEILPEPTPLTWDIVQRLLAQDGGFGMMNRDLGADPDPSLGSQSAYDLVAGRPMLNLTRLSRMQFRKPPLEYPIAEYKADLRKALDPQPVLKPWKNGILGLPGTILRMMRMASVPRKLLETFAEHFTKEIAPAFASEAKAAMKEYWSKFDNPSLLNLLDLWIEKTLVQFARDSLKPTVLAKLAWDTLAQLLTPRLGAEKAKAAVAELSQGALIPDEAKLALGLRQYAEGLIDEVAFLERFSHRGRNEMELASPRWSEIPPTRSDSVRATSPSGGEVGVVANQIGVHAQGVLHLPPGGGGRRVSEANTVGGGDFALDPMQQKWLKHLRTYIGLREAGKHTMLMGYAVIRRALVELDSRLRLNGGIFHLHRPELAELVAGKDFTTVIAQRKKRRAIELSLELPTVLFSDDLDAIGRAVPPPVGATTFQGIPLSAGVEEGTALVLVDPSEAPDEPFVLVCPSTDPAWVPLFAKAKALVMETGGVLSHGAIVAREFGLPAVAGLPGIVKQLKTGQRLKVDGGSGIVIVLN
jgi:phosphohistidine swiveling domain-containing protein